MKNSYVNDENLKLLLKKKGRNLSLFGKKYAIIFLKRGNGLYLAQSLYYIITIILLIYQKTTIIEG